MLQLKLDSTQEDCQQWKRAHAISSSRLREVHDQLSESEDARTVSQASNHSQQPFRMKITLLAKDQLLELVTTQTEV